MNELVSIIIPCFNASKYIFRCLNSLICQTYKNIEIICVNDGSSDNTLTILNYFSIFDKRIKVFSNSNHGVSFSRNTGLEKSNGKYICFVDCDDFVSERYIEQMVKYFFISETDLVVCGFDTFDKCLHFSTPAEEFVLPNNSGELLHLVFDSPIFNPPWNKMFKKQLIKNEFNNSYSLGEDVLFNCQYVKNIKSISFINKPLYFYNINGTNKLTNSFKNSSFDALKELFCCLKTSCKDEYDFRGLNTYIARKVIELINIMFHSKLPTRAKKNYFYDLCLDSFWNDIFCNVEVNFKNKKELSYIIRKKYLSYRFFMFVKKFCFK